jgi:hypothetical protein
LELVLDGPSGSVEGRVQNTKGEPVVNAQVVLIPAANRRTNPYLFSTSNSDQSGKFSITGVPPGDYSVLAWEQSVGNAYKNVEFLKDYEPRAIHVTVMKGATSQILSLRPVPGK